MRRVLVASVVAHVALFALVMRTRVVSAPVVVAPPLEEMSVEMEEDVPVPSVAAAGAVAMATERRSVSTSTTSATRPVDAAPSAEAPVDSVPYSSNGTILALPANVGLSGANPFLVHVPGGGAGASEAPTIASADPMYLPPEKRAEQSVKDALRAHDQSIGLGLEGPVVHALEDATHSGFAPSHGTATFVAVIDEHGIVIDLKVLTSTASGADGAHGWENVRKNAVQSLARARIDMRGVKRAELKIAVESDVLLPSGNKPDAAPIQPGSGARRPVAVSGAGGGSPSGDVVQTVEVAQFDLSDIGAKAQHVVHARLTMVVTR